jgi:NADH dehydrogenase
MVGVDEIVHLAGAERGGLEPALRAVDVEGTRVLAEAARQAGVRRLLYVSHLYPALRAKARAEAHIIKSEVPYTILRSSLVYGEGDRFTTALAMLLAVSPLVFPVPGDGSATLQPLWVEDLATCVLWSMDEPAMRNQSIEIGGPEFLTILQIVELVMHAMGSRRWIVKASPPLLRALVWALHRVLPQPPVTTFWLDYLATSRTASLDALPRLFGLKPALMTERVGYLKARNWAWEFLGRQFSSGNGR